MTKAAWVALLMITGCSEYDFHANTDPSGTPDDETSDPNDGSNSNDPNAPKGSVTGRICAPSQNVYVAGADVWVEFNDGTRITSVTDADGYFTLEDVPAGIHTVYVSKGSFTAEFDVSIKANEVLELAQEECLEGDINIAVVTGAYDNVENILDRLGLSYDTFDGDAYGSGEYVSLLGNPSKLAEYDIIFFNCGMDDSWAYGYGSITVNEIRQNVRQFVQDGGSLYASDWAYYMVEAPFPGMVTFVGDDNTYSSPQVGESGYYTVDVLDPGLKTLLGSSKASINYDLPSWVVPEYAGTAEVLVRGTVTYYEDWINLRTKDVPLVLAGRDNGRVLYTSFHNEAQTTVDMDRILEQLALDL
jgi:hypothetical protein